MSELSSIAVGTLQPQADGAAITWGLMDALVRSGYRVQSFHSHAYFQPCEGATAITGLPPRHLDSWLMPAAVCRQIFVRGAKACDVAVIEGAFKTVCAQSMAGEGEFETLCRWLNLPRLAIVDARLLDECRLPNRPEGLDGLLLDKVADSAELCRLQTLFHALWNVPVVGWLGTWEPLRRVIASIPAGQQPSLEVCHALGKHFLRGADLERIRWLASSRPFSQRSASAREACREGPPLRIAVAQDAAFNCYFPDTLDALEAGGATLCDFSPLRDERLPTGVDIVYLGCGHPERFARELSENDCMMLALKSHLCGGRRIYAEGGGLAYLCLAIELPGGQTLPMVGALNAIARFDPTPATPRRAEVTLARDSWLGSRLQRVRGYVNPHWRLTSSGSLESCIDEPEHKLDMVQRHQAIGSRLHLNFAAQSELLGAFFTHHQQGEATRLRSH